MGKHVSVLLDEAISLLNVKDGGIYADLTLGRGGHSSTILSKIPHGHLYSFDLDEEAIEESRPRLEKIGSNFTLIHSNFAFAKEQLAERGVTHLDGVLMDLGVSSPQFDEGERGFSYRSDGPLDMRMDQSASKSAATIVNSYPYEDLVRIFARYGEDPDSKAVAKAICKEREITPIKTTFELVELIKKSKPAWRLRQKGHPAKQIFQALRIETNGELDNLEKALKDIPDLLNVGGRFVIISFQSLEDRLVKDSFRALSEVEGTRFGPEAMKIDNGAKFISLTRHPILPSEQEQEENHRSKSAKLRAVERKED